MTTPEPTTAELIAFYENYWDDRPVAIRSLDHWSRIHATIAALRRLEEIECKQPDGYVYLYHSPHGHDSRTLVHNGGELWNGQKPIKAIPYIYLEKP